MFVDFVNKARVTLRGNLNELDRHKDDGGRAFNRWYSYYRGSNTNNDSKGHYGESCPDAPCDFHHHKMYISNSLPTKSLRMKQVVACASKNYAPSMGQAPTKHSTIIRIPQQHRSSGITSYAPVDGLKFVPYQTEIPGPAVMYEYVTMKETSNSGEYDSKTRYRHHVPKTRI